MNDTARADAITVILNARLTDSITATKIANTLAEHGLLTTDYGTCPEQS